MPKMEKFLKTWKRYVDYTITYIKSNFITGVINILNKNHENIKFTYKVESDVSISFLHDLLM